MADVTVTMTAQDAGVWRKFQEARMAAAGIGVEFDTVKRKAAGAGDAAGASLDRIATGTGRVALQFLGVGSAIAAIGTAASLIRQEYERMVQLKRTASDEGMSIGAALEKHSAAVGGRGFFDGHMKELKQIVGLMGLADPVPSIDVMGELGSARDVRMPGTGIAESWQFGVTAAKAMGRYRDPGLMKAYGGSMLDIAKTEAIGSPMRDPEIIAGQLLALNQVFRTSSPEAIARFSVPILAQAKMAHGGTVQEMGALLGSMGETAMDTISGRTSAQASIQSIESLYRIMASHPMLKHDRDLQEKFAKMTPWEVAEWTHKPGEAQDLFLAYTFGGTNKQKHVRELAYAMGWDVGAIGGEEKKRPAVQGMYDPGSEVGTWATAQASKALLNAQTSGELARERFKEHVAVGDDMIRKQGALGGTLQGAIGQQKLGDEYMGRAATGHVLKFIEDLGAIEGTGALQQKLRNVIGAVNSGTDIGDAMRQARDEMQGAVNRVGRGAYRGRGRGFLDWRNRKYPERRPHRSPFGFTPDPDIDDPALHREWIMEEGTPAEQDRYRLFEGGAEALRGLQGPGTNEGAAFRQATDALLAAASAIRGIPQHVINVEVNDRDSRVMRRAGDMPLGIESLAVG